MAGTHLGAWEGLVLLQPHHELHVPRAAADLQRWLWWEQATFSDWKVKSPSGSSDLERTHDLSFDSLFVALETGDL